MYVPTGVMVTVPFKPENYAVFKALVDKNEQDEDYLMFVSPSLEDHDGVQPLQYGEDYDHEEDSWESAIRKCAGNKSLFESICEQVEENTELVVLKKIMETEGIVHMRNPITMSSNTPISPEEFIRKIQEAVAEFRALGVPSESIGMSGI